ncbi:MAG: type IV pilin-like G/H family protein, partial [Dolichospermum sp.]
IIGILSAIALPSFLSQAAKSKQTEAKTFVGAVNRAQQAHRMENTTFSGDLASLQVNIPATSEYYTYAILTANAGNTTFTAIPVPGETSTLRAYAGGVTVLASGQTASAACMTTTVSGSAPTVNLTTSTAACASAANNMK